jgi:hypothetical protein
LGPIKTEFFTGPAHHARVENLARASKRNLRLSAFSMHRYHDATFAPLTLMPIETAPLLDQPFSKCCAFHCYAPVDDVTWLSLEAQAPPENNK